MPAPTRSFAPRHVQLLRAVLAAVAALMITFSADHSADVGLSVFGGFAVATALVLLAGAVFVWRKGQRWPAISLGVVALLAGMVGSYPDLRSESTFFIVMITWAAVSGAIELVAGIRSRGSAGARDAITIGALGLLLAVLLLLVPVDFAQQYIVEDDVFTLTGITIGVGLFGGYAAIVAVFLGIAGLAPVASKDNKTDAGAGRLADHGGIA